jgi:glycosyltransferase involved in cell wall biosynthesis
VQKVVAILTSEAPTSPGGVEHVVRELLKGLEHRGYEVLVLHRENAVPTWLRHPQNRFARELSNLLISWYLGRKLRDFRERQFAAVISNGPVGWYVPNFKDNSPTKLHIYHGTYRGQAEAIRPFITQLGYLKLKWWDSMVIEKACGAGKKVLSNSDQTREEVHEYFDYEASTTWLPLDVTHFRPLRQVDCRNALGLPTEGAIGLFAGSIHPMKGFPIVQSLIQSLPGMRWLLALRGSVPADLSAKIGVRVFQNASYDLLPTLYGAADFAVFPSRYEPFGYVVAEALACGTPVIAAPGGASRLFLQPPLLDSLLIEDPTNFKEYVAATRRVLNDGPSYRRAVIQDARPKVVQTMAPENWWLRFFSVTGL